MYASRVALAVGLGAAAAFGQSGVTLGGGGGSADGVRFEARVEPETPGPWAQWFQQGSETKAVNGYYVAHRYLFDDAGRVFFGYDVLLEPQAGAPDTFQASFFELGIGAVELPADRGTARVNAGVWKKLPLVSYPAARVVHTGDRISIELWTAPDTGQRIIDELRIEPGLTSVTRRSAMLSAGTILVQLQSQLPFRPSGGLPSATVSGPAHDFSAADAELRLTQPRVSINGMPVSTAGSRALTNTAGTLVWFHVPPKGRYILSLAPRPELGFVKAGEIRGGAINFKLGDDSFTLESSAAIATGDSAYTLYVLYDPDWEPTAQSQRGYFQSGSVAPGEIELLQRK